MNESAVILSAFENRLGAHHADKSSRKVRIPKLHARAKSVILRFRQRNFQLTPEDKRSVVCDITDVQSGPKSKLLYCGL